MMWYIRTSNISDTGYILYDIGMYVISIRLPFNKLLIVFR